MADTKNSRAKNRARMQGGKSGGMVYCLGLIGAAVFYIQQASGFGEVLVALVKAIVWPAYFVWEFFSHLN